MKKKICFFIGNMGLAGGSEHMTQMVANELAKDDLFEIHVLSNSASEGKPFYPLSSNVVYNILEQKEKQGSIFIFSSIRDLKKYLLLNKIDLLVVSDVSLGIITLPIKLLIPKIKQIYWDHFSSCYNSGTKWAKILEKMRTATLTICDAYVTITPEDRDKLQMRTRRNCNIVSIPNMCPFTVSKEEYNINSKIIISAGRLVSIKGFDYALKIAKIVLTKHPDWEWRIYGEGPERKRLEKDANDLGIGNRIIFEGRIQNIQEAYRQAGFFVLTSRSEAFGLVLIEALAHKLPAVAFDVPYGPRNIIKNNVNGFLCKPFDIEEMANKICLLIENSNIRLSFSKNTVDEIGSYSASNIIEKWKTLLEVV